MNRVSDIEKKFALVEERFRALLAENEKLRHRIGEIEAELEQTRLEAGDVEQFDDIKHSIRNKIERILRDLEVAEGRK